ncbi:MAG: hypothetical protein Q8914_06370 [Bacteroidota bacterium]|nr:hypothetical protein [Bacteroidota bacterium]
MKHLSFYLCFLMALCTACQPEHQRQVQMLNDLLEDCEQYDTLPSDADAHAVLFYMERHGSPVEQQQAWRMMAKVYRRHGALFYEGFAYEMALDCVDSTSVYYDPRTTAELLYESSINQFYNLDDMFAHLQARRAMALALSSGDTLSYYRYMGQDAFVGLMMYHNKHYLSTARMAADELWQRGRKDWSVDAFFPYMVYMNNGTMNDSVAHWMNRYTQYTHQDLQHAESFAAIEYWKLQGDFFMHTGDFDSAYYYYNKLEHHQNNYARCQADQGMLLLYDTFSKRDPNNRLRNYYENELDNHLNALKRDRLLEGKEEYRQRKALVEHELTLQQRSTSLFYGLLLLVAVCVFIVYRYRQLRLQHQETLRQNYEYAELIKSSQHHDRHTIIDTAIAHRFHDLSAEDTHPKTEEWQSLQDEINRLHPHLFTTLQQQYAEHQSGKKLTEQECHVISLLAIRCSPLQMSVLLVCTKSNASNIRRRLFYKLTGKDGSGIDLDRYIQQICEGE